MWCYCNILPCQINRHQRSPVTRIQTSCFFVWKLKTHHFLFIKCNKGAKPNATFQLILWEVFFQLKDSTEWFCVRVSLQTFPRETPSPGPRVEAWYCNSASLAPSHSAVLMSACVNFDPYAAWRVCMLIQEFMALGSSRSRPHAHSPQCESVIWCVTARLCCCVVVVCVKWVINKINSLFYIQLFKCLIQYPSGCTKNVKQWA